MLAQISAIPPSGILVGKAHVDIVRSPLRASEKGEKEEKVAQDVKMVTALDEWAGGEPMEQDAKMMALEKRAMGGRGRAGGVGPVDDLQESFPSPISRFSYWQTRRTVREHSSGSSRSPRLRSSGTPAARKSNTRADSPRPTIFRDVEASSWEGDSSGNGEEMTGAAAPFRCQVCFEDRPAGVGFELSACQHTFCRECLHAYVKSKVMDGQVFPTCFFISENCGEGEGEAAASAGDNHSICGVSFSPEDIEAIIGSDRVTRSKYARFLFCRENQTARECPRCSHLQVGDPDVRDMRCQACQATFCYKHGGAHEGKSCAEHEEATADETGRSLALIGQMTKPCPGCHTPVEKLGGCNQMVCCHCNASFCWICGAEVDRGAFPAHFQWWNINGCPNQQLQEAARQEGGARLCHRVISALQVVVVGPVAFVLTIVSSALCACCLPAFNLPPRELFTECISGWGNFIMMLPVLPFALVGVFMMGVIYVINLPFRIASDLRRKYRQEARHEVGTSSREVGVDIRAQVLREHPELMAALAAMDAAENAGALPAVAGVTPALSRNAASSARGEGMAYLLRSGSAPSSSSAQSALSPFPATLGYDAWGPREELEAIVQKHEQHRRLRLPPAGSISSDADSDSSHYETNSRGTMRNSMPLLRASSGPLPHIPPQPLAVHNLRNSGPVGGSSSSDGISSSGSRGVDRTASASSFFRRGQTNDGAAARGGTGSGTDPSTVEMTTAVSLGFRDMMVYLLRASSLRPAADRRVGGSGGIESISHSGRGDVDNVHDSARSTREARMSAVMAEERVADTI